MKQQYSLLVFFSLLGLLSRPAAAQIQGHIFRDVNASGTLDEGAEPGLAHIRVNAYDRFMILLDSG